MAWNAGIPDDAESPGLFPTQAHNNWNRLFNIVTSDHNFTVNADATQGYHKIVHWVNQGGAIGSGTPAPAAGVGQLYTKTITTTGNVASTAGAGEHLCYQRGTGGGALQEASISACPVRAAVLFRGRDTNGACTINWAFNVSGVQRVSSGHYTVTYATALPSIYYVPLITCGGGFDSQGNGSTDVRAQAQLATNTTHSSVASVNDVFIRFYRDSTANTMNPFDAAVVIFGG